MDIPNVNGDSVCLRNTIHSTRNFYSPANLGIRHAVPRIYAIN